MLKILLLTLFFMNAAFAWWDTSHMAVAKIAEQKLSPRAKFHIQDLLSVLADYYPESSDFVTASCWADDIKDGLCDFSSWHKQLTPYDPEKILNEEEKERITAMVRARGLEFGINKCIAVLNHPQSHSLDKGIALRLLIHLVADAHMPLHCAALYTTQFPQGDRGGVLFPLKNVLEGNENTLHGLWDSCVLLDYYEYTRPLTPHGRAQVDKFAQDLMNQFPSLEGGNNLEVDLWVEASYNLAVNVAYKGIFPETEPSQSYLTQSKMLASRQLVLAGYRLANLLNGIFESNK